MKRKRIAILALVGACLLSACQGSPTPKPQGKGIPLTSCQEDALASRRIQTECADIPVYENPSANSGRKINLHVTVVPSTSRNPAPDPLFFIAGGPGESAAAGYAAISKAFSQIQQDRDIILVDQRGAGKSNPLTCPSLNPIDVFQDPGAAADQPYLEACLSSLDADPRFYTTSIAMQDLDQVRAAMGYDQINLYGGSYGTRAALVYLRMYPQHVRSLILDGVDPPNWILGPDVPQNGNQALQAIFGRCANDAKCQAAFPNVAEEFQSLRSQLQKSPADTTLMDPQTGQVRHIRMTLASFDDTLFQLSYTPETASLLPLLIHTTVLRQDFSLVASQRLILSESTSASVSDGMNYSVICAEDYPFSTASAGVQAGNYLANGFQQQYQAICSTWPRGDIPTGFHDPVASNKPVLLISGEMDPITPPQNAQLAANTLTNSLQLVAPGQGHINILHGCIPRLATTLVQTGSLRGLDAACLSNIQPEPFFLDFSGPQP